MITGGSTGSAGGRINLTGGAYAANPDYIALICGANNAITADANALVTIGTGTATQHALNTLLATNGAQVATLTNLPAAATAGNPSVWIKITVNGATRYIPAWA